METKQTKIIEEVEKIVPNIYLIGGACRDILLGKEPKDFDFSTPLNPDEIENLVRKAGRKPFLIGKKFGGALMKLTKEEKEMRKKLAYARYGKRLICEDCQEVCKGSFGASKHSQKQHHHNFINKKGEFKLSIG